MYEHDHGQRIAKAVENLVDIMFEYVRHVKAYDRAVLTDEQHAEYIDFQCERTDVMKNNG